MRGFLFQLSPRSSAPYLSRQGAGLRGRATGFLLALVVEALLVLLILTLGSSLSPRGEEKVTVVRFKSSNSQEQAQETAETKEASKPPAETAPKQTAPDEARPLPHPQQQPSPAPVQVIKLSPRNFAAMDISNLPSKPAISSGPARPVMGPADTGPRQGDTPRVSGSGPNGEPLYAASWYREPYPDELGGYLSTASGPGWGLIACKTAPDFRVEDCVKIDEYPEGSNIARSVLAAAWQFRVRPPRIGGEPKIGEWVRIRIDYDFRPRARP